jgi:hypothetical protein
MKCSNNREILIEQRQTDVLFSMETLKDYEIREKKHVIRFDEQLVTDHPHHICPALWNVA